MQSTVSVFGIVPILMICIVTQEAALVQRLNDDELSIMTYNIFQPKAGNWDEDQRLEHLIPSLESMLLPDVIVFTEVFSSDAQEMLSEWPAYQYKTDVVGRDCEGDWTSTSGMCSGGTFVSKGGVMVVSRYPILSRHQYVFIAYDENTDDDYVNKGAIYTPVQKGDRVYHVFGTQLQANEYGHRSAPLSETHQIRVQQCVEINEWIGTFELSVAEIVIVAGDFIDPYTPHHHESLAKALFSVLSLKDTVEKEMSVGSFSVSTNDLAKLVTYENDQTDYEYNDYTDFVLIRSDYGGKIKSAMHAIEFKSPEKFYWRHLKGTWPFGYHDGNYSDLSDHYPVMSVVEYRV